MPYARDSLTTIRQRVLADIATRLPGSDPFVRRSPLGVLGTVFAALQNDQFGMLDWMAREGVPFTCDAEYLDAWAALPGVTRNPPAIASGIVTFTGNPSSVVPNGQGLSRSDGATFTVPTGGTIGGGGTLALAVTADVAGSAGNTAVSTVFDLSTPASGVAPTATVTTQIDGGTDLESDASLRTRMLQRWREPPQGGDLADYVEWARSQVPAVTRAWAGDSTIMGAGTVTVYFMMDDDAHVNGIPTGTNGVSQFESRDVAATGDQLTVADAIYPLRPVTALVYGAAPVSTPLNITLAEVPVDTTIREGITAALNALCLREASPAGIQYLRENIDGTFSLVQGGTIPLSHLDDAISAVPGLDHYILTSPTADITVAAAHLSTPGTITYI